MWLDRRQRPGPGPLVRPASPAACSTHALSTGDGEGSGKARMPESVLPTCFAQELCHRPSLAHTARVAVAYVGRQECQPAGEGA